MKKLFSVVILILSIYFPAFADSPDHNPRFLVHLLDYLAKDYGGAVANGKVLSESEYQEQIEFVKTAVETNSRLSETKNNPQFTKKLRKLSQLILKKSDADQVSTLARELQREVIQITQLEVSPIQWPNLKRGKELFSQNCSACHGENGAGDGPAGAALNPKPANFLDEHMNEISPFQAFNTVRLGVPGTGMAPFVAFSDKEVWDLAFYIVSLRHKSTSTASTIKWNAETLKRAAILSDNALKQAIEEPDEEKVNVVAALRTHSDDDSGGSSLNVARIQLEEAFKAYQQGNFEISKTKALKAYLEGIEPVEPRLKASDASIVSNLENKMAAVRGNIQNEKPVDDVKNSIAEANVEISKAEALLSNKDISPWLAFLAAAAILLREGFEAVLIVIALLGVIRATSSRKAALWVHGGWTSAVGLGVLAWIFSGWLMNVSGAQREMLEGTTSIFAVVVLLIVGFWLHSQTEIGRWTSFIHGKVQKALEGKNLWALASISFVAVFREAFETVLFLRAIWLEGGNNAKLAMGLGVIGSFLLVLVMAWAILKYSAKLPIRTLFGISAAIMAVLALILTGKGLHSLQETGILSVTSSPAIFQFDLLGFYPTWETLVSQVVILSVVFILWNLGRKPSQVQIAVEENVSQ